MKTKTFTSIAMAGVLAASTVVATATAASAGGGWGPGGNHRHHHGGGPQPHYQTYQHQGGDAGGALVAGAFLGLAFGLIASEALSQPDPYPPHAYQPQYAPEYGDSDLYSEGPYQADDQYAAVSAHADWCRSKYRTYNEESDTFVDYRGVVRRCVETN